MIRIKLYPGRSIAENAQLYFKKYKNIADNKLQLKIKKDTYQAEFQYWKKLKDDLERIATLKEAEKFYTLLISKRLIQASSIKKENLVRKKTLMKDSFHHLILAEKWQVHIGKNDHNNDRLTFKFANKYDLWLHAQGVSGSHVIIHLEKEQSIPMHIIEQAACLAAYYSKAKNSSIVPVNYTKVKYVRKPRKAAPGTVIISQEKTLFVKPQKLG
jgi:predicted ribosome quality control (RQC) complex YloA/Tae2 family protein